MAQPEQKAREEIDRLLNATGWHVCDVAQANLHAARGVAIREFPLAIGHGYADYLLYLDGKAAGTVEAGNRMQTMDRDTRQKSDWQLDDDFDYFPTVVEHMLSNVREADTEVETDLKHTQGFSEAILRHAFPSHTHGGIPGEIR